MKINLNFNQNPALILGSITKKAATQGCCFHQSGVGGVRTLVQTMGIQAFYMLIS